MDDPALIAQAFGNAIAAGRAYRGATAPNPPVGCVLLDPEGATLACAAHARAGAAHAEAAAIAICRQDGTVDRIDTVVVTLEPCNHTGRTPPCTEAILATPARRAWIGTADPDPKVTGGGAERLRSAGLAVRALEAEGHPGLRNAREACLALLAPFAKQRLTGRPWITTKQALDARGSMIPPPGRTTFTSGAALVVAHRLRRRADAILTGSGTVLADDPAFTVRRVPDHPGRRRRLVVLDRRRRVPDAYLDAAAKRGFDPARAADLDAALDDLGRSGVLEVLVEAGPSVTGAILERGLWDEHIVIRRDPAGGPDTIEIRRRDGGGMAVRPVAADLDI